MPGISFFIPAYNCEKTVAESVASIMESNFQVEDELLIVDDCSTDNTASVLEQLQTKYPAIQIIKHENNKGGAAARNTAVEAAGNGLLFCLDSDNILAPNSISALKAHLIESGADMASFQEMRYFSSGNRDKIDYTWKFLPETSLADFMADNKNPGSSGNYLFTKESWIRAKGYPEFAGALDTWGFCFRQLATGSKLVSLPGSHYLHRYGSSSYYIRDMNSRNMSIAALQIILPFYDLIHPEDLDYLMSKKSRFTWFDNFESRPIRIKDSPAGKKSMTDAVSKPDLSQKVYRRVRKIFSDK